MTNRSIQPTFNSVAGIPMKMLPRATFLCVLILLCMSFVAAGQSGRVIGVLPFDNLGSADQDWVGRGIEELLNNELSEISGVSLYERETLKRVLKETGFSGSRQVDARKAFSIGKNSGIEVLFLGDYRVDGGSLILNLKMVSTYTGSPILEQKLSEPLENIFASLSAAVLKGLATMQITASPDEITAVERRMTSSLPAFEAYCRAYMEIDKQSPLEVTAGYFQRALQADPDFWEAQYNLGVIYYNFRFYDKALQQFNAVITRNSQYYKAYFGKGVIAFLQNDHDRALREFRQTLAIHPTHDRSYFYMGITYTRIDSLKKGIQSLEKSIEINPNYAPAHYQLGLAEMERGWFKKAISALSQATRLNPAYYQANNALGEAYYALNLFEEAIIEFNKAIKLKSNYATAYFNLGNAIYRKGALAEIVDAFWSLLETQYLSEGGSNGTYVTPISGLEELREKAKKSDNVQILRDMVHAYRTALSYDERFYEASYNLALTYENLGKPDSAEIYYKKAISQKFDIPQAHMRLGKLYEARQDYRNALQEYRLVVEIEPDFFAANPKLGEPYRYVDIIQDVLQAKMSSLEKDPRDRAAVKTVGKIYLSLGRFGQAEEYFQQLVDLNPNDALAQQTLREIRRRLQKL